MLTVQNQAKDYAGSIYGMQVICRLPSLHTSSPFATGIPCTQDGHHFHMCVCLCVTCGPSDVP